jgi:hypothetical protein
VSRIASRIADRQARELEIDDLVAAHARATNAGDGPGAISLARELAMLARVALDAEAAEPARRPDLVVVGPDTAWLQWSGGKFLDLRRRRALRLVLEVLLEWLHDRPGEVVDAAVLIARGWPGETVRPSSAASRLYVTVLGLRRLGFRGVLLTQDRGYLLDPTLEVSRALHP